MDYWIKLRVVLQCLGLTHFIPLISFKPPENMKKHGSFVMFSGGIEKDRWHEMG